MAVVSIRKLSRGLVPVVSEKLLLFSVFRTSSQSLAGAGVRNLSRVLRTFMRFVLIVQDFALVDVTSQRGRESGADVVSTAFALAGQVWRNARPPSVGSRIIADGVKGRGQVFSLFRNEFFALMPVPRRCQKRRNARDHAVAAAARGGAVCGDQGFCDFTIAFKMTSSLRMQAVSATLSVLPAARRRS